MFLLGSCIIERGALQTRHPRDPGAKLDLTPEMAVLLLWPGQCLIGEVGILGFGAEAESGEMQMGVGLVPTVPLVVCCVPAQQLEGAGPGLSGAFTQNCREQHRLWRVG